jgi:tetratricopeptide (TPR) repeat protein
MISYHREHGASAESHGDFKRAAYHYGKIITVLPSEASIHERLGGIFFQTGEYPRALAQYNESLRYDRNAIAPRVGIARVLLAQHRVADARGLIETVLRLEPDNKAALEMRAGLPAE